MLTTILTVAMVAALVVGFVVCGVVLVRDRAAKNRLYREYQLARQQNPELYS